jgi:hypothetical protein
MWKQSRNLFVLAFVLLLTGAWLDGDVHGGGTCDTLCHMRTGSKFCGSGNCVEYEQPTCIICWGWNNLEPCLEGNGSTANCVEKIINGEPLPDSYYYYTTCDEQCDCANVYTNEAVMTGNMQAPGVTTVYACGG